MSPDRFTSRDGVGGRAIHVPSLSLALSSAHAALKSTIMAGHYLVRYWGKSGH